MADATTTFKQNAAPAKVLSDTDLREQILTAFKGNLKPQPVPFHYRIGLLITAIAMVMLPLVYIGLIGVVGWWVYQHAIGQSFITRAMNSRNPGKGEIFLYLTPLVVGATLVLFMIKPLFAARPKSRKPIKLDPKKEPLLFDFVARICKAVGSPMPREIHVDCQVNASASFRRGMLSMFGSDLVLTIGMPLAAGLSLKQFGGVLAHEFGHFAQAAGMRLTYVIRSVSHWFARVVYERDAWDEALTAGSQEIDIRIGVILYAARAMVWVTRQVLWVLMWAGHAISCFMLRQMEYDADSYEARLCGSDNFESTARQLLKINVANQQAMGDLQASWHEKRLADDIPALMVNRLGLIKPDVLKKLSEHLETKKTGLLDTHPADKDRITAARTFQTTGMFTSELPAVALFKDFSNLSRTASMEFYQEALGPQVKESSLRPVAEFISQKDEEREAEKTLARFLQHKPSLIRPVWLPSIFLEAPVEPGTHATQLTGLREQLCEGQKPYEAAFKKYDDADTRLLKYACATALNSANCKIDGKKFDLTETEPNKILSFLRSGEKDQKALVPLMEAHEMKAGEHLLAALKLLKSPEVAASLPEQPALLAETEKLLPIAMLLTQLLPEIVEMQRSYHSVGVLINELQRKNSDEKIIGAVRIKMGNLRRHLTTIQGKLGDVDYPFEHASGRMSLKKFALPALPGSDDLGGLMQCTDDVMNRLAVLYFRLLGRLAAAAEKASNAAGLPPLPDLPDEFAETKDGEKKKDANKSGLKPRVVAP